MHVEIKLNGKWVHGRVLCGYDAECEHRGHMEAVVERLKEDGFEARLVAAKQKRKAA